MARSSIEISALESERRKLRGKVEMFQRQVRARFPKMLVAYAARLVLWMGIESLRHALRNAVAGIVYSIERVCVSLRRLCVCVS